MNKLKIDNGNKYAHENFSKSNDANLGKVALTQIATNIIKKDFANSQNACSKYNKIFAICSGNNMNDKYFPKGLKYPPKNSIDKNKQFANNKPYSLK